MKLLKGQFSDIDNNIVSVSIFVDDGKNGLSDVITIGENGLYFSGDPITIETDMENTFSPIIRKSCTINLLTKNYIGDTLWAANANSISVEIKKGNNMIYYGHVEPNTYSQPFVSLDEFSINCIDALSALQYYNYKNATPNTYNNLKNASGTASFKTILFDALSTVFGTAFYVYYDCSKGISQGREQTVFDDCGISESYLFGETYDDIWTYEDVIGEIMKYLNLHIIQQGNAIYIFDWDTLKNRRNTWCDLDKNKIDTSIPAPQHGFITSAMHSADDTNITVSEVYNQVSVSCNLENIENVISSPLDSDSLKSPYGGKQLYMREYISPSNGKYEYAEAFYKMMLNDGSPITYDDAKYIDHYMQFKFNPQWIMNLNGNNLMDTINADTTMLNDGQYINQWKVAKTVKDNSLTPAIISMGSVERSARLKDDSPTPKVSMTDYLFISVNGNEVDDNTNSVPTPSELQKHAPIIEYLGGNGGVYSPSDKNTINYLVFSGSMLLQPKVKESGTFKALETYCKNNPMNTQNVGTLLSLSVKDSSGNNRLYTRKFFNTVNCIDDPDEVNYLNDVSLQPWCNDNGEKLFEYKYSEDWGTEDKVNKLPVLECELIIGNKRLIEIYDDEWGHSTFEWVALGDEPEETYDGETYKITTFTLGINPKIDDFIIGQEYKLQNTVTIPMNIDAEGTAIPIEQKDRLSGAIQFRILGPVNSTWNQVVRRHPTWFRHTKWSSENKIILAHLENIIIKDFKCQIFSNNAGNETEGNDELIYVSDETDRYINKYDSTEFNFITQPTSDIIVAQGLKAGVNLNAVVDLTNDAPLQSIYNAATKETAKAEEHYVNQYYSEYSVPRLIMEMTVHNSNKISWRNNYDSAPLNKSFYVIGMNDDVRNNTTTIKIKSK